MNYSQKILQKFVLAFLASILIIGSGGCTPTASNDPLDAQVAGAPPEQAPLPTEKITAVDDLPVPANMTIKKSLSRSYEGAGTRMIDYTYSGRVDIRRVHRFYRDQMPLYRWQLLTDNYIRGVYTLIFRKDSELCTVIISKDNIFWTKAQMIIQQPQKNG